MPGSRKAHPRRKSLGLCSYPRARCVELEASDGNVSSYHNLAIFALSKHIAILER
jgi:hypothetical protein